MPNRFPLPLALLSLAVLSACSSVPATNPQLNQARTDYRNAERDPRASQMAATEMKQAQDALNAANAAWDRQDTPDTVGHLAYITRQRVAIARETMTLRSAEQVAGGAGTARNAIRLEARTQEAEVAHGQADKAQRDAQAAQRGADIARAETAEAQRKADAAQAQNVALQARLSELNARATPRGLVLTLGDVLFDSDQAHIKAAGLRLIRQLAVVLTESPTYNAQVEGFTDSTGTEAHNLALSGQRADAVRASLLSEGVSPSRVTTRGLGESNPAASNDSADGRLLNRRVEIVLSDGRNLNAPR